MFRATRCVLVDGADSIGLVVASFRRNTPSYTQAMNRQRNPSAARSLEEGLEEILSCCRKIFCNASLASA
jgi:hypothetical protein